MNQTTFELGRTISYSEFLVAWEKKPAIFRLEEGIWVIHFKSTVTRRHAWVKRSTWFKAINMLQVLYRNNQIDTNWK